MLTTAFQNAASLRAKTLGLHDQPMVVAPHPLASKTGAEVKAIADTLVEAVASGLAGQS
jgi:hypothetical protein